MTTAPAAGGRERSVATVPRRVLLWMAVVLAGLVAFSVVAQLREHNPGAWVTIDGVVVALVVAELVRRRRSDLRR